MIKSEAIIKAKAFEKTLDHLKRAMQDPRRREQKRAKIGYRTMMRFLDQAQEEYKMEATK